MPTSRRALLLALVAILAVSAAHAEKPVRKPQEVVAPYWTSEPGWDTELQLKNNLAAGPLTVTPVLRLASGEEIPLDPVTIPSNVSASVWVNEQLLKHSASALNQPGSFGSVALRFTSFNAGNLYTQLSFPFTAGRSASTSTLIPPRTPSQALSWRAAAKAYGGSHDRWRTICSSLVTARRKFWPELCGSRMRQASDGVSAFR